MKKIYVTTICLLIIFVICSIKLRNVNAYEEVNDEPPIIRVLKNNLTFYEDEEFSILDYVEVNDDSNSFTVNVIDEDKIKKPGEKIVEIEAIDEVGNTSYEHILLKIISNEEWNNYVNDNTYNYTYRKLINDDLIKTKGYADHDAFNLALNFIGMKGACNEVAQAFIDSYFGEGYDILLETHPITLEEARPGDIIYYTNGGLGLQHYAIYLGGSSALQGNINGTTVIGSVYMSHGSTPQFRRLNEIK